MTMSTPAVILHHHHQQVFRNYLPHMDHRTGARSMDSCITQHAQQKNMLGSMARARCWTSSSTSGLECQQFPRLDELRLGYDGVNQPILNRLLGGHEEVAVRVLGDDVHGLPGELGLHVQAGTRARLSRGATIIMTSWWCIIRSLHAQHMDKLHENIHEAKQQRRLSSEGSSFIDWLCKSTLTHA